VLDLRENACSLRKIVYPLLKQANGFEFDFLPEINYLYNVFNIITVLRRCCVNAVRIKDISR